MSTSTFVPITLRQWADDFLAAIGAPRSEQSEQVVVAWELAESDESGRHKVAAWNPLNTTNKGPGSSSFNSVGVQNYPDLRTGIEENARALVTSGHYPTILRGLQAGNADLALSQPREWSTWGTGAGIERTLPEVQSQWPRIADTQLANATPVKTGSGLDPVGSFEDLFGAGASAAAGLNNVGSAAGLGTGAIADALGLASGDWHSQLKNLVLIGIFAAGGLVLVGIGVFRISAPVREPVTHGAGDAAAIGALA